MVYTERTDKYTSPKNNNQSANKSDSAPKYAQQQQQHGSSGSSTAWSKTSSGAEKWQYNDMVQDNRDKFNSLHFC